MFAGYWRRDHAQGISVEPGQDRRLADGAATASAPGKRHFHHWKVLVEHWIRVHAGGVIRWPSVSGEAEVVHAMGEALEHAEGREAIERILIESVHSLTGARTTWWSCEEGDLEPIDGEVGVMIGAGLMPHRRLFLSVPSGRIPSWPASTLLRLRTLCTMASHALTRTSA